MSMTPEQKVTSDVEEYGVHIVNVMEDDVGPGFAYSIGLYKSYGHPDFIIFGLKPKLMHVILNNLAFDIREGKKYSDGDGALDILEGYECFFRKVPQSAYSEYLGHGCRFYLNQDFPVLQCVWPSVDGLYPWQSEEIAKLQPVLGSCVPGMIN